MASDDDDTAAAYRATQAWLERSPGGFLHPRAVPSVVNLGDLVLDPQQDERELALNMPGKGQENLTKALETLEALDKEEANLVYMSPWTVPLTQVLINEPAANPQAALEQLQNIGSIPRRVCQYPFKKNDLVYMCRTCQADETCALCHDCFSQSNHEGHDVAFFHAQEGGCCDCGDPDAWSPLGFCPNHGAAPISTPRRAVCQKPFKKNDLVYFCRTCQADSTCAFCHECYNNSDHEGHDVAFYHHQQDEGCCDCGDPEAWDPKGFCPNHGPPREGEEASRQSPEDMLPPGLLQRTRGVVSATMDWMVNRLAQSAHAGAQRTMLPLSAAESSLGPVGQQGHGLYLVLQADDIHTQSEVADALHDFFGRQCNFRDVVVAKMAQTLTAAGQLIIWGPMELAVDCGRDQIRAWLGGEPSASSVVASSLVQRAVALKRRRFYCRIATLQELQEEQQAVAVMQWMTALAFSCDPLCETVAEYMRPSQHLVPLLEADFVLPSRFTKMWYSLLLTLLAVPAFKSKLGAAYCDTYDKLAEECARGKGVLERSAYALSVQFLNRDTYVLDLVTNRDLLAKLGQALLATFRVAEIPGSMRLNPNNVVLSHRRYSPCISDLNYVINVKGMKRLTTCQRTTFLVDFVSSLSLAQCMDPHSWRHWDLGHVEEEDLGWYGAFNLCITLGGLCERILSFDDEEPSPIKDQVSPLANGLLTCEALTYNLLLNGITKWQNETIQAFEPTPYTLAMDPHRRRSASLPFSTIAAKYGCTVAFRQLPVGQSTPFSLHLPLHRFLASCLRELCMRLPGAGMRHLIEHLINSLPEATLDSLFFGLLEFPVLVLSRAAQVRAGLWRRNGPGLSEQVKKYADPAFCRSMRDSDLALVQFAILKRRLDQSPTPRPKNDVSASIFVHLLLHRLGLFDFAGLSKAPGADPEVYEAEVTKGLYPREAGEDNGSRSGLVLPWTYTPARDASDCRVLMEEFLFMLIIFTTELPPVPPTDKNDHVEQARLRLRRQVIHRLAAGPKTHSELADLHSVLSFRDNMLLNEEGKLINPDDATAAMLGEVLGDVAERKASRSRLEPDKFVLRKTAWQSYDPSFYHISVEGHQTAAESRPVPSGKDEENRGMFGASMPYAPVTPPAHPEFERLRRDVTADATVISAIYRILNMHCSAKKRTDLMDLRVGRIAYDSEAKSEILLARAVHLLTIGCFAWQAQTEVEDWRESGGGSPGSFFFDRESQPSVSDWLSAVFLADPSVLLDCNWYDGEENLLILIHRLAVDGGASGNFVVQDPAVQAGAVWLCEFAAEHCPSAAAQIGGSTSGGDTGHKGDNETELDCRKRQANERAMAKMNAQAAQFASKMQGELQAEEDVDHGQGDNLEQQSTENDFERRKREAKEKAFAKMNAQAAKFASSMGVDIAGNAGQQIMHAEGEETDFEKKKRLAKERAMAKINSQASAFAASMGLEAGGEDNTETDMERRKRIAKEKAMAKMNAQAARFASMMDIELEKRSDEDEISKADSSVSPASEPGRLLQERPQCIICSDSDAECFVAFAQGSTVLKGGGGPHHTDDPRMTHVRRFAGTQVALCGHCVHSDCSHSYLAKVQQNDNQGSGLIDEFRCPLCQRPSNCLVPFIDVCTDWVGNPTCLSVAEKSQLPSLSMFLDSTRWWVSQQHVNATWDRHSLFTDPQACSDTSTEDQATGEVITLKKFMEHISGVSYAADSKRLGKDELQKNLGEFRHYIVERRAYNEIQTEAGNEPSNWPSCVAPEEASESQIRWLFREKAISQLLMSIESLTYSACCEAFEARRRISDKNKAVDYTMAAASLKEDGVLKSIYSKFGICGSICDGKLILMPPPSSTEDHGAQPFNGRLGRLRYLALPLMAAASATGPDLVQLVLPFPSKQKKRHGTLERAPIANSILLSHVLTHIVAAMCATSGGTVSSSSVWTKAFAGEVAYPEVKRKRNDVVAEDCEGFLKLGFLARVLQALCCELNVVPERKSRVVKELNELQLGDFECSTQLERDWLQSCLSLLKVSIGKGVSFSDDDSSQSSTDSAVKDRFQYACLVAAGAASNFLADAGTIMQFLVPGVMTRYDVGTASVSLVDADGNEQNMSFQTLQKLCSLFRIESIDEMLQSSLVCDVVTNWYSDACEQIRIADGNAEDSSPLEAKLFQSKSFRSWDWPLESLKDYPGCATSPLCPVNKNSPRPSHNPTASRKTIPLLGGYSLDMNKDMGDNINNNNNGRPCIDALTTSYMDLYAKISALKPDADRTAVCLVCGEALDASGNGECTRHSYICGAGTGIFFLLQECVGLIMHRGEGSYIYSIYVDSHGETPRGRPLYLDMARLEHLRELWAGHMIRQQVIAERESTQQGVVRDFY